MENTTDVATLAEPIPANFVPGLSGVSIAHPEDFSRSEAFQVTEDARWSAELGQGSINFPYIFGVRIYPKVEIFRIARAIMVADSISANQEITNLLACEYRKEILEVLVQVRLLSSAPRLPWRFPIRHRDARSLRPRSRICGRIGPYHNQNRSPHLARFPFAERHVLRNCSRLDIRGRSWEFLLCQC